MWSEPPEIGGGSQCCDQNTGFFAEIVGWCVNPARYPTHQGTRSHLERPMACRPSRQIRAGAGACRLMAHFVLSGWRFDVMRWAVRTPDRQPQAEGPTAIPEWRGILAQEL